MTFAEKFESIKKKFVKADLSVITEDFAVQINMTDEDCGGSFYIAYKGGRFDIEPYDYVDNTATATTNAKTFEEFISGKKFIYDMAITGNEKHVNLIAETVKKKTVANNTSVKKSTAAKKKNTKA